MRFGLACNETVCLATGYSRSAKTPDSLIRCMNRPSPPSDDVQRTATKVFGFSARPVRGGGLIRAEKPAPYWLALLLKNRKMPVFC
jgi:hypothetical protein